MIETQTLWPRLAPVLAYSLAPVGGMLLGVAVATLRTPGATARSFLQHLAAGVVFAVVSVELLPDVTRAHTLPATIIGFSLGVALMLGVRALTKRLAPEEEHGAVASARVATSDTHTRFPVGLVAAIGIDLALDGMLLGIAFAAGAHEGLFLTIALAVELLSLGLALVTELAEAGLSRVRTALVTAGLAALVPLGAVAGTTTLRGISDHTMAGVLSFGCAALLYLVTEELLVEAHEVPETPLSTAMFFVGFLLLFTLQLAAT